MAEMSDRYVMRWFAPEVRVPLARDSQLPRVAQPIGKPCAHCEEPIGPKDEGVMLSGSDDPWHQECFLRQILGSVAHQTRRCSCYGGDGNEDDDDLSRREAARRAVAYYQNHTRL